MFHMQSLSRWTIGKSLKFHITGPLRRKYLGGNACSCVNDIMLCVFHIKCDKLNAIPRGINFSIGQKVVLGICKVNAVLLWFRPDIFVNKATVMFPRDNEIEKDFRWATLIYAGHVNKKNNVTFFFAYGNFPEVMYIDAFPICIFYKYAAKS